MPDLSLPHHTKKPTKSCIKRLTKKEDTQMDDTLQRQLKEIISQPVINKEHLANFIKRQYPNSSPDEIQNLLRNVDILRKQY